MIPVFQTMYGAKKGNCHQAALASILELDLYDVPNFMVMEEPFKPMSMWLAERNIGFMFVKPYEYDQDGMKDAIMIGSVKTESDVYHSVIVQNGKIIHDPLDGKKKLGPILDLFMLFPLDIAQPILRRV